MMRRIFKLRDALINSLIVILTERFCDEESRNLLSYKGLRFLASLRNDTSNNKSVG